MSCFYLALSLSELLELNLSIEKTILYACGSVIITGIICLLFYSNIANKEIYTLVSEYVSKNLQLTLSLYENMGMKQENIQMISTSLENIKYVFIRIIPALVVASTLFISWINLLLSKSIFKNWNIFILILDTFGKDDSRRKHNFGVVMNEIAGVR